MQKSKRNMFLHILNVITVALIIECFLCSLLLVRKYARNDCFERIEETTKQMSHIFTTSMEDNREKLVVFADILAANSTNPDELLMNYMENFCRTQDFSAVCIHRANGSSVYSGDHTYGMVELPSFEEEVARLPYVSDIYSAGDTAEEKFFYQAVPIVRKGETVGILYAYMKLSVLPEYINSTAYDGACYFYIVDGDTGDFIMDTWHKGKLGNIDSMGDRETRDGYDIEAMRQDIRNGGSGYFVFKSRTTGEWLYTYYMPTTVNNWSIQMTIDEKTAFVSYDDMGMTILVLSIIVIVLMFMHVVALMIQTSLAKRKDKERLKKAGYMYEVQHALLNAHNNPGSVERALKIVANELQAETVLLLTVTDYVVNNSYYWPSKDRTQAMELVGRNIRDDFPVIFDSLFENKSFVYYPESENEELSPSAMKVFERFDVSNIIIVPVMDNSSMLKGAICAVNLAEKVTDCELLECVTYDFFMAITNVENHNIIKNMGAMDYLTNIKNRNSYELELLEYTDMACENLWCVFVDVNGLRELNNTRGHKAGDIMLCAVAAAVKKAYGDKMTYRVGGDEFVAFVPDITRERMINKKEALIAELKAMHYNISVGFEAAVRKEDGTFDIERVIDEAEAMMYSDKREFHQHEVPSEMHYM